MKWIRIFHKWASIVVGIQFLLWLLSGIYFNLMDTTKAKGRIYQASINYKRPIFGISASSSAASVAR